MADELQVQQGQSSAGAYGLTGAAIGGVGAGVGAHYLTKPKYASHDDIINEAKDSTDFSSKIEKAEGEEKKFLQAAKEVADERAKAEKAWDDGFATFKEAHKDGVKDDEKVTELLGKKAEYEKTIADLESKAGTAGEAVTEKVKKDPLAAIRQNTKKLNDAAEEIKALKASGASKESIDAVQKRIKIYEQRLENVYNAIIEAKGLKGDEAKALKAELQGYSQDYMAAYDRFSVKTPAHGYTVAKQNIAREEKALEEGLKIIKETSNYDLSSVANDHKAFFKKANIIIKGEENRLKALEKMLEHYNVASGTTTTTTFWDRLTWLITGKNIPEGEDKKAIEEFIKGLSDKEKKLLQGKEVTAENIQELITASKEKVNTLRKASAQVTHSRASIKALQTTLADKEREVVRTYGKGAYINEEGIICKGGKKIGKVPTMEIPEFKPASKVELPKEIEIEVKRKTGGAVPKELTEARKNLADVTAEIETRRASLPKTSLTEAEQLEAFAKSKGVKDRQAFIDGQVKDKTEKFAKDFEAQFKRKWGFAEHTNWKIAGAVAAGAAVIGGLAALMAPKNNA